jgi:hypothetical protein
LAWTKGEEIGRKCYPTEQIIGLPGEAEVLQSQGMTIGEISRKPGIAEKAYYRWRKEYGGMRLDQANLLKELEKENGRCSTQRQMKKIPVPRIQTPDPRGF